MVFKYLRKIFKSNCVRYTFLYIFYLKIGCPEGETITYRTTVKREGFGKSWNYESSKSSRGGRTTSNSFTTGIYEGK